MNHLCHQDLVRREGRVGADTLGFTLGIRLMKGRSRGKTYKSVDL